jgi:nucleotide-binding universal stress UspA family protein
VAHVQSDHRRDRSRSRGHRPGCAGRDARPADRRTPRDRTYPVDLSVDNLYPAYARALGRDAEQAVKRAAALAEGPDAEPLQITTTVVPASATAARAHELAEREEAGVLVIGSSRRGTAGRVLPGAVTDRLLEGAPCPVAVAPAGFSTDDADAPRMIGTAFIDTPDGRAALETACELATAANALVRVLTVAEPFDPLLAGVMEGVAGSDARRARDAAAESVLRRGIDRVPGGRSAGGSVLSGDPADALAAASRDLDLLVCGSRGYGPLRTLVLGGTSHALVRKASCPVLVVPLERRLHAAGAPPSDRPAVA